MNIDLIFGLVAPIGTKIDLVQKSLEAEISAYKYEAKVINVSEVIDSISKEFNLRDRYEDILRIKDKIELGNKICKITKSKDFLSLAVVSKIKKHQESILINEKSESEIPEENKPTAFIIRQLKRPEEVKLLKEIYGGRFIQISANNSQDTRLSVLKDLTSKEYPEKPPVDVDLFAQKIINDDADEASEDYGQRISDTFYTADFFVECKSRESVDVAIKRFLKGIFGSNLISPTRDEYGSYFAKAASLKAVDMSRQVGAAIFTQGGEIVIMGCNDVAKAGGGLFWEEDQEKHRDIDLGSEANKEETSRIIYSFLETLQSKGIIENAPEQILSRSDVKEAISDSLIGDITEYGRMVHAEMNAITDAGRLGRSLNDTNMYVTTYPCHNCAKHIVASGVRRVVYIEPYPKSRAAKLYRHAITDKSDGNGVIFEHFYGISPTIYKLVFERRKRKSPTGGVQDWQNGSPHPVLEIKDFSIAQNEKYEEYISKFKKTKDNMNTY
ncbi:anti-phage dCTP deaminase [Alcaligenes faecalis]|uniref:anti-phage dCTP deaminase n=1 Tax=Alcaligenes faecalis TaxID=511 RepID=UPI0024BD1C45|nr:anti-phage dCTP deaminase [Alcaligenes faecalis]WHQ44347.1 deoxycytidylate deaminase [Alcaligenes faecalis]